MKWASDHRRHHRRVDKDDDPYNIRRGFWRPHISWLLIKSPSNTSCTGDLERDPLVRIQQRFYIPLAVLAAFPPPCAVGWLFGDPWGGLVLGGFLRLVLQAPTFGRRTHTDRNSSRDSFLTALLTLGEGDHNSHHAFSFDNRNGVRGRRLDPTKWLIRSLSWTGITAELVRTPRQVILKARLRMQQRQSVAKSTLHPGGPREHGGDSGPMGRKPRRMETGDRPATAKGSEGMARLHGPPTRPGSELWRPSRLSGANPTASRAPSHSDK